MLPKPPPKSGSTGFLYLPPYRVQGISIAGEQTTVQIPELDIAFDVGLCPRTTLTAPFIALSHAHMDHVAGLPYYFSQRVFQKMGTGTCFCHKDIAEPLKLLMNSWVPLEQQKTKHNIIGVNPDDLIEIKPKIFLKPMAVDHTVPSLSWAVIEKRSKLLEELSDLPQTEIQKRKRAGQVITKDVTVPLVVYTGDCAPGPTLLREEFINASVVITECTFFDDSHKSRASVGKHLHLDDLVKLLAIWKASYIVVVHVSRRTPIHVAKDLLVKRIGVEAASRVFFLMDHRENKNRYQQQTADISAPTGVGLV